jgi:hypothetical protein
MREAHGLSLIFVLLVGPLPDAWAGPLVDSSKKSAFRSGKPPGPAVLSRLPSPSKLFEKWDKGFAFFGVAAVHVPVVWLLSSIGGEQTLRGDDLLYVLMSLQL